MSRPVPNSSPLLDDWCRLVGSGQAEQAAGAALLARWAEPHRAYHTTAHLVAVLARLDELAEAVDGVEVSDAVRLAAWWHDAVYDPQRADNEARSAYLATVTLGRLAVDDTVVAEVSRLVWLTAGHRPAAADTAGAALSDADLAVLASPPAAYRRYAEAVRREYRHLTDQAFGSGRATVLRDLLARPSLYATAAGRRRWESAARANLAAELAGFEGT